MNDYEIGWAVDKLAKAGLFSDFSNTTGEIYGAESAVDSSLGYKLMGNSFRIKPTENGWIVHKLLGQVPLEREFSNLPDAVEFVLKLYEPASVFADEDATAQAIRDISTLGVNVRLASTRKYQYLYGGTQRTSYQNPDDVNDVEYKDSFGIHRDGRFYVVTSRVKSEFPEVTLVTEDFGEAVNFVKQLYSEIR